MRRTLHLLLPMTRGFRWTLAGSLLLRVVTQLTAVAALVTGVLAVLAGGPITPVVLALLGLALLKGLTRYGEQYLGHRVAFILLARLRVRVFAALLPQAPAIAETGRSGDLLARTGRDVDALEVFFAHTIVPAIAAVLTPVALVWGAAVLAGPAPAAVLAAGLLVAVLAALLGGGGDGALAARRARQGAAMSQFAAETVHARDDLLGLGALPRRTRGWGDLVDQAGALDAVADRRATVRDTLVTVVHLATVVLAALVAAPAGAAAVAAVLAIGVAGFAGPVSVVGFADHWREVVAAADRIDQVLSGPPAVPAPSRPAAVLPRRGALVIGPLEATRAAGRGVRVPQPLRVPAGAKVRITGSSGSGKSTLLDLIARVHDPDTGGITIDGVPLTALSREQVVATVAVVDQHTFLFDDTIAANLRVAAPAATEEALEGVLAAVGLGVLVAGLPRGLETRLGGGRGARRLSGGQAQRLGLARALLTSAPVLLVDEATSQLDRDTAGRVRRLVLGLADRTVLWVSHREDQEWPGPVLHVSEDGAVSWARAPR